MKAQEKEEFVFNRKSNFFCYLFERELEENKQIENCYFYILNHSTKYIYEGNGRLINETTNSYVESQTERNKPGYIMIKALESGVECALSGLNGANYRIHELQHVYFTRSEGYHILQFRNNLGKRLRFRVQSGRGYFIVNSERCVEMESNKDLPVYENKEDMNMIELEAKVHNDFINQRNDLLKTISSK